MSVPVGRFLVADYASDITSNAWAWRCYAFTVAFEIEITSLIGGFRTGTGHIALFAGSEEGIPSAVIAHARVLQTGRRQTFDIEPVVLVPGSWYMLGQGAHNEGNLQHVVSYWDVEAMLKAEKIFDQWRPVADEAGLYQMFGFSGQVYGAGPPEIILGGTPTQFGLMDARPDMGFFYGGYKFMTILPKVDGVWLPSDASVKVGGSWRLVEAGWVKEKGVWKSIVS